jgi:lysophospholipase L1-like esterase
MPIRSLASARNLASGRSLAAGRSLANKRFLTHYLVNGPAVQPAFAAAKTARVDFVGIGDSNQIKGGTGWDDGWQYALATRLGLYGSGLIFTNENEGSGNGTGYFYNAQGVSNAPMKLAANTASGTVSIANGSAVVTGSGTAFTTQLAVNQTIQVGSGNFGRVISVDSNTQVTCAQTFGATVSGQTLTYYDLPPSQLYQYVDVGSGSDGGLTPLNYEFVNSGQTFSASTQNGMALTAGGPFDVTSNLIFSFRYGTFTTGTGSFKPGVRLAVSPFSVVQMGSLTSTNTGSYGLSRLDVQISADATRAGKNLEAKWAVPGQTAITGPWFGSWIRCSDPAKTAGCAYTTLDFRGGRSLRRMAKDLQEANAALLTEVFSEVRRLQGATKYVVVTINSAVNDRNETLASVGPNPATPGNSAAAFADNAQAIINAITAVWTANSWPATELYFLLLPTHPISDPDDAQIVSYRSALTAVCNANSRTAAADLTAITSGTELTNQSWYLASNDHNHLVQAGYENLALRLVDDFLAATS